VASTVSQQNYYFDSSPVYTRHKDWKEATIKASMKKEGPIQITRQSSKTVSTSVTVDQQKYVVQIEKQTSREVGLRTAELLILFKSGQSTHIEYSSKSINIKELHRMEHMEKRKSKRWTAAQY
jgi:hypothetical protein